MSLVAALKVELGSLAALVVALNVARENLIYVLAVIIIYLGFRVRWVQCVINKALRNQTTLLDVARTIDKITHPAEE